MTVSLYAQFFSLLLLIKYIEGEKLLPISVFYLFIHFNQAFDIEKRIFWAVKYTYLKLLEYIWV